MNLRLLALGGAVAGAIALPLAMASAGPIGDGGRAARMTGTRPVDHRTADATDATAPHADARSDGAPDATDGAPDATDGVTDATDGAAGGADARSHDRTDPKAPSVAPSRSPLLLGLGLATAARCGPELTSRDGVQAQTCVLSQGEDTWARTYYRNATGRALEAFLNLMGPAGRTVRTSCAVAAEEEPESCETPHERTRGELAAYTAIAEFARATDDGPLLLRSGSNSRADTGS